MKSLLILAPAVLRNAAWALSLLTLTPGLSAAEPVYPLKVSENHRYFVDQKGEPVFWLGTTQWQLFREYKLDEARTIIEKIKARGFAFAQVITAEVTPLWIRRQAYYSFLSGASRTYGHNNEPFKVTRAGPAGGNPGWTVGSNLNHHTRNDADDLGYGPCFNVRGLDCVRTEPGARGRLRGGSSRTRGGRH